MTYYRISIIIRIVEYKKGGETVKTVCRKVPNNEYVLYYFLYCIREILFFDEEVQNRFDDFYNFLVDYVYPDNDKNRMIEKFDIHTLELFEHITLEDPHSR